MFESMMRTALFFLSLLSPALAFLPDPDCVRGHAYWPAFQRLTVSAMEQDLVFDIDAARLALTKSGCALGKLTACLIINEKAGLGLGKEEESLNLNEKPASELGSPIECFYRVTEPDFKTVMASRWPIYGILDRINQKRLKSSGEAKEEGPMLTYWGPVLGLEVEGEAGKETVSGNANDCEVPDHPTIDWTEFRMWTKIAVREVRQLNI